MTQPMDPFDELAELFLTEPEQFPQYPPNLNDEKIIIELAIIGHLPVRAGVWLTPYADAIAREEGPTALLRMETDSATLQLIRAQKPIPSPPESKSTLDDAIALVASAADTWIVRPPPNTPMAQLVLAGADRLTILSSADEAAVVAAYQIVKELYEAAEKNNCQLPTINLAVLGSDRHAAERMRQRLNRTTNTFLGIELQMVACIGQMDATIRSTDFGKYGDLPDRKLRSLLEIIDESASNAAAQHPTLHEEFDEPESTRPTRKAPPLSIIKQIAHPLITP
ncbi:MAG: hypothetical protein IH984_07950, partial [Planctomycetes bacterium]|nr:hypothetical protein [Planctomycetota bacterium]